MNRGFFALAGISTLAAIIAVAGAGCSSDDDDGGNGVPTNDGGGQDARPDRDATPDWEEPDGGGSCMSTAEVDTSVIPYKKARVQPLSCTAAELATLKKYADDHPSPDLAGWRASVGATCAACVFADGSGDSWSPLVVRGTKVENLNVGGCLEAVSGNKACGEAYQRWYECPVQACKDCSDQATFDACTKNTNAIYKGPCKAALLKVQADCGNNVLDYEDTCFEGTTYYFEGSVNHLCVAGPKDAGGG